MRPSEKMKLVDMQGSEVSVAHQCRLLNLSRSRLYYVPKGVRWSRKLGQRFRNYKLRNYEKDQTRIQFSVQS